jgi:hypothetical protein
LSRREEENALDLLDSFKKRNQTWPYLDKHWPPFNFDLEKVVGARLEREGANESLIQAECNGWERDRCLGVTPAKRDAENGICTVGYHRKT